MPSGDLLSLTTPPPGHPLTIKEKGKSLQNPTSGPTFTMDAGPPSSPLVTSLHEGGATELHSLTSGTGQGSPLPA